MNSRVLSRRFKARSCVASRVRARAAASATTFFTFLIHNQRKRRDALPDGTFLENESTRAHETRRGLVQSRTSWKLRARAPLESRIRCRAAARLTRHDDEPRVVRDPARAARLRSPSPAATRPREGCWRNSRAFPTFEGCRDTSFFLDADEVLPRARTPRPLPSAVTTSLSSWYAPLAPVAPSPLVPRAPRLDSGPNLEEISAPRSVTHIPSSPPLDS